VTRLDELTQALVAWLEDTGRPCYNDLPPDVPELPYLTVKPQGNSDPEDWTLEGVCYRNQSFVVTTFGRSTVDALWLGDKVLELLTGTVPAGASMVLNLVAESSGTPAPDAEGRMLCEHRLAVAYA
jgi:hypothetical protein